MIENVTIKPVHAPWLKQPNESKDKTAIKIQNNNIYIEPSEEVVDIHNSDASPKEEKTPQIFGDTGDHSFPRRNSEPEFQVDETIQEIPM
jgi:hypothetical protein